MKEVSGTRRKYQEREGSIRNTQKVSGTIWGTFPSYNCHISSKVHIEQLIDLKHTIKILNSEQKYKFVIQRINDLSIGTKTSLHQGYNFASK